MNKLLNTIRTWSGSGEEIALATIVKVKGSAYLREGAKMLFTRSGQSYGMLSAGCLEDDLRLRLDEVFSSGKPQIFTYDTSTDDDLLWGTGSGCNGVIDIFIEPVSWETDDRSGEDRPGLPLLSDWLDRRYTVAVAKCISGGGSESSLFFVSDDGHVAGELNDNIPKAEVASAAQTLLQSGESFRLLELPEWDMSFFIELFMPEDRLFVFGAGADAEPLVELAGRMGFSITLVDPRVSRCNPELFPAARHFIVAHPQEAFRQLAIGAEDYVLAMTHHFLKDQEIVANLMTVKPRYFGILGPTRRTLKLLDSGQLPAYIHSPAGLPIGAKGADEISVSIVAELIEARRKRESVRLSIECTTK